LIKFIAKKIAYGFVILFGVVTIVFFLQDYSGGNPALLAGGNHATEEIIKNIEKDLGLDLPLFKRYLLFLNDLSPISLHNDIPESHLYLDTAKYSGQTLFDVGENTLVVKYPYLRRSYNSNRAVADILWDKLPNTIILAFSSIMIAFVIGVFFGILSARYRDTFFDKTAFLVSVTGMSAPSFFSAAIIANVFGYLWSEQSNLPVFPLVTMLFAISIGIITWFTKKKVAKFKEDKQQLSLKGVVLWGAKGLVFGLAVWLIYIIGYSIFGFENLPLVGETIIGPGTGLSPTGQLMEMNDYTGEQEYHWENILLPAITLGIRPLALVSQLMRSSMLDVMSEDYIRTARAKGLSENQVIIKHALKNAMNPVVTATSGSFASLLAGAIFVEHIFDWKGIGHELLSAITNSDLPLIMGVTLVISAMFIVINIGVDIIYGFLDPRVRLK
jgi:peptide/nickel transport system permease protein